jgi:hypothetical protein
LGTERLKCNLAIPRGKPGFPHVSAGELLSYTTCDRDHRIIDWGVDAMRSCHPLQITAA